MGRKRNGFSIVKTSIQGQSAAKLPIYRRANFQYPSDCEDSQSDKGEGSETKEASGLI